MAGAICAQQTTSRPKVAVLAPLYLDSVFAGDAYKAGKGNLPKYILPGLDFYNGVMLAIDSLNKENAAVEVLIYDTKSSTLTIDEILAEQEMQDVSLIVASFNQRSEIKRFPGFAKPNIDRTYRSSFQVCTQNFSIGQYHPVQEKRYGRRYDSVCSPEHEQKNTRCSAKIKNG